MSSWYKKNTFRSFFNIQNFRLFFKLFFNDAALRWWKEKLNTKQEKKGKTKKNIRPPKPTDLRINLHLRQQLRKTSGFFESDTKKEIFRSFFNIKNFRHFSSCFWTQNSHTWHRNRAAVSEQFRMDSHLYVEYFYRPPFCFLLFSFPHTH